MRACVCVCVCVCRRGTVSRPDVVCATAIWTLVAMILLGLEKQQDVAPATHDGSGSGAILVLEEWAP